MNADAATVRDLTLGVILAGGRAARMGGQDKTLVRLGEHRVLDHLLHRLAPQCAQVVLNANGDPSRFGERDPIVVPDSLPDQLGPLAGILAAMEWTALHRPGIAWIVSVPGDTPFIPNDLIARLHLARHDSNAAGAYAASDGRPHWSVGLWPVGEATDLRTAITKDHIRQVGAWVRGQGFARADWPVVGIDPFFNINTPDDLAIAETSVVERPERAKGRT